MFIKNYYSSFFVFPWPVIYIYLLNHIILLHYLIYDKNGKAIDSFIAAAGCGDGGWGLHSYGKFISEDTYEEIMVETEMVEIDSVTNAEVVEGDSTVTHYIIGPDGRVTQKEISKTPIRRIYN